MSLLRSPRFTFILAFVASLALGLWLLPAQPRPLPVPLVVAVRAEVPIPVPHPVVVPTPTMPAHAVAVADLVNPFPEIDPARAERDTYAPESITALSHGGFDDTSQIVGAIIEMHAHPNSVRARVGVACGLAQIGQHYLVVRLLEQLRDTKNCPACTDALLVARMCKLDARGRAIADAARPSNVRIAMEKLFRERGRSPVIAGRVRLVSECSVCDADYPPTVRTLAPRAIRAMFDEQEDTVVEPPAVTFCRGACCDGPTGWLNHFATFTTSACFASERSQNPRLTSLTVISG